MGIPDHLTCLLRNLYAGQEATVRTGNGTTDWFQIWKWVCQGCILSPLLNIFCFCQVRTMSVLYRAHLCKNVPWLSLIFLKWSLVFPILLSSSISLHWPLRKAFLSLLAILWNSAFRCLYLSFSPLLFTSLLFTAICKASLDSHFASLHFFSMGMVLIPVSCTMSQTSIHSSSGTLTDLVTWIYFSLPLYNHEAFDLGHTWMLLSRFSHVWLCATPEMAAQEAPLSLGFSRQEHWSGLPFPSPMHKSESEVAQSCPTLRDPMDCSLPGSSVHGIFQARVLEWGAITFSAVPRWAFCFSLSV